MPGRPQPRGPRMGPCLLLQLRREREDLGFPRLDGRARPNELPSDVHPAAMPAADRFGKSVAGDQLLTPAVIEAV